MIGNGGVRPLLERCGARCLAVDLDDPDTLYVVTSDIGLFGSEDGLG